MKTNKHTHDFKAKRPNPTILICDCGKFQNVITKDNPAIVGIEAVTHTPTPWEIEKGLVVDSQGNQVWNIGNNTEFIVKAVNMHDELVQALREQHKVAFIGVSHKECRYCALLAKAESKGV